MWKQRLYQHMKLTDEPPEPAGDIGTATSGVNPMSGQLTRAAG
jgi:hypothetical protein